MFRVINIKRIMIKSRQRAYHPNHYRHRMSVAAEAVKKTCKLIMHHGVLHNLSLELAFLHCIR